MVNYRKIIIDKMNMGVGEVFDTYTEKEYLSYIDLPNPAPTKEGYTFEGWYTGLNGGSRVFPTTNVTTTSDHKLYAHWKENPKPVQSCVVTFDANGGHFGSDTTSTSTVKTVEYDTVLATLETPPTKDGSTFAGWTLGENDYDFTKKVRHAFTLKAKWTETSG